MFSCENLWVNYLLTSALTTISGVCACACWNWGWSDSADAGWKQGSLHHLQVSRLFSIFYRFSYFQSFFSRVEKSDYFTRKGADVHTEAHISLAQVEKREKIETVQFGWHTYDEFRTVQFGWLMYQPGRSWWNDTSSRNIRRYQLANTSGHSIAHKVPD